MNKENIIFAEKPTYKRFQDLENQEFNRLTVLGYAGKIGSKHLWWCECSCPNETITKVQSGNLQNSNTKSCGCYNLEQILERSITHNMTKTSEYRAYCHAKGRCENPNDAAYHYYGGRGIKFLFDSFEEFYKVIGDKPEPKRNYTLERMDTNGHYEAKNICWDDWYKQGKNKRDNVWIEYNGQLLIIQHWAEIFNISSNAIGLRLKRGWCIPCTLNKSSAKGNRCEHKNETTIKENKLGCAVYSVGPPEKDMNSI